ncbi:MAG: dTMP kinase [Sphingobium sp.]|nr:dTMP kinase [Sphingobium sp.]
MARGRFITLEGGEGVGKSTQARALAAALEVRGISVVLTREPGGSPGAEAVRELLLSGDADRWSTRAEALLFAAQRADHVEKTIMPAVDAGKWVICDRFVDSSRAYQSVTGELTDGDIVALHEVGSRGLLPDRTLLLTLPGDEADQRASVRDGGIADRIGGRDADFHAAVNAAFVRFAEEEADRFRKIDASGSPDEVTLRLLAALDDWLA